MGKEIYANQAARMLDRVQPNGAAAAARVELAAELLEDLRSVDAQVKESKKRLTAVATASGTTTTTLVGVGPVIATTVIGITGRRDPIPQPRPPERPVLAIR